MNQLSTAWGATPEELAAWVSDGPKHQGIAAYLNANELDPPPRFHYGLVESNGADYLSPLMACWFLIDEIANFVPIHRYITGAKLIDLWTNRNGIKAEAFIRAKIAESRLLDAHPIYGLTQGSFPEDPDMPPLKSALFLRSHVELIEAEDFGIEPPENQRPEHSPATAALEVGSPEWRSKSAKTAIEARHNRPGGSRDKQRMIREIWASGKYSSRDLCAEEEYLALKMSFSAARKALRNVPKPT